MDYRVPAEFKAERLEQFSEARRSCKNQGFIGEMESVHYTKCYPLHRQPIVLSVSSIKLDEAFRDAKLQLGVWQAAQCNFKFLLDLWRTRGITNARPSSFPLSLYKATTGILLLARGLTAWQFVGTTSCWWYIIHALRHVAAWIHTTYWPWYKRKVLGLPVVRGIRHRIRMLIRRETPSHFAA
ncbi:hypothetical protein F4861DRAFT_379014 [Xylaria intraflava]|nr:hypothetical protein F4861DRAFT_379014 [Xylaria intraflava]